MRKLAGKVAIVINPDVEAVYPAKFGASVKLTLADGAVSERLVLECHGTPSDPCTGEERMDKFRLLAGTGMSAAAATELARLVDTVASISVRALTNPLRFGGTTGQEQRKLA
jgi:2-methylcitrate dehydratase PrpD